MFKKILESGYIVVTLYVFGAGFWIAALFSVSYKVLFCAAAICILAGFVRSLSWLWNHSIFERPRLSSSHTRRYSDRHPNEHSDIVSHEYAKTHVERRRRRRRPEKRKKLRWTAEAITTLLLIAAGVGLNNSYAVRSYKELPIIDVLISDRKHVEVIPGRPATIERIRARHAPYLGRLAAFREKVFDMAQTPTENIRVDQGDKSVKLDVILKNLNGLDVRNAHVTVESDVHLTPVTQDFVSLTDKQLYGNVAHVTPPDHSSDERVITVEIPIPQNQDTAGIYVTIQADNLKNYGAVARILFVKGIGTFRPLEATALLEKAPQ